MASVEGSIVVDEDQKDGQEILNEKESTLLEDKVSEPQSQKKRSRM